MEKASLWDRAWWVQKRGRVLATPAPLSRPLVSMARNRALEVTLSLSPGFPEGWSVVMVCGRGRWKGIRWLSQWGLVRGGKTPRTRTRLWLPPSFPLKSALVLECLEGDNVQTGGRQQVLPM